MRMAEKTRVLAVVGPTASGKTALGVGLARLYGGQVISADSMQIYRGMDIATAKPTAGEMQGVKHHLLDFLDIEERYSVAAFVSDARKLIGEIAAAGGRPMVVGGTGLYVQALLSNMEFQPEEKKNEVRALLEARRTQEGIEALYAELCKIDPAYASTVHVNNEKRVLRALEICYTTGKTPTEYRAQTVASPSDYRSLILGLDYRDRETLYALIDRRVDRMLEAGLLEEARAYFAACPSATAAQAIGYKELAGYFAGTCTLEEAKENLKRATRRYAKRQLTWFKRMPDVHWIVLEKPDAEEARQAAVRIIEETGFYGAADGRQTGLPE
ncbi:MAG: tRNA (adenosine(37)-N6)-dimethylallyltransferase MiaA [Clostridia bacterium]|nr:tRNA (adenosine(37)-N6)-dimethylallyltransferase MiaA [Clostridia bacterium]